jgi:hypothetical protein
MGMKIRNGFVSNSSSSSFVLLVDKKVHDKVFETLTDYEKKIISQISEVTNAFGCEVIEIGDLNPNDCSYTFEDLEFYESDDGEEELSPYEAFYNYESKVFKLAKKDEVYRWSMG